MHNNLTIKSHFIYKDERHDVEFYEIQDNNIPQLPWTQIYIVGNLEGKVPIVKYQKSRDNLPGGGIEAGETLDEAVNREVEEELNMKVLSWMPLGYQKVTNSQGDVTHQLRAYGVLEKIDDFTNDPGGSVIGYELIDINDLNSHINYGEVGDFLVKKVVMKYGNAA